jgi:hypothetical protein
MPRLIPALLLAFTLAACGPAKPTPRPEVAISPQPPAPPPASEPRSAPEPPQASRAFHDFLPSRDGFRFVNAFSGSPLPLSLGAAEKNLGLPSRFGLCGGMSTAAADFFLARRPVPVAQTQPGHDTPLYNYLYARQAASIGPLGSGAARFIDWMNTPDDGPDGVTARTLAELPAILAQADQGRPVILGLVLVSRVESASTPRTKDTAAWENHQVLCYGVSRLPLGLTELKIYDPNFPGRDDAIIRIAQTPARTTITRLVPGRPPLRVRGLFSLPYIPATPPVGL